MQPNGGIYKDRRGRHYYGNGRPVIRSWEVHYTDEQRKAAAHRLTEELKALARDLAWKRQFQ